MKPQDFAMFRKNQAMISLTCPRQFKDTDDVGMFINGAVFDSAMGKINWDNKITIKLGIPDVGSLLSGMKYNTEVKLFHQFGDKPAKVVNLSFNSGKVTLYLEEKCTPTPKKVFVNLQENEYAILQRCLEAAVPMLLGWQAIPE